MPSMPESLKLHLYCHGLGDCILIELPRKGSGSFWILVDCGIHTSSKDGTRKIRDVVADIAQVTGKHLDIVIGTHEHWDHNSGFSQAADLFAEFEVAEVWFSWAEDPSDPQARELDKFKGEAVQALAAAAMKLDEIAEYGDDETDEDNAIESARDRFGAMSQGLDSLLGFVFGIKGERSREAREALRGLGKTVRHFEPGAIAPLPEDVEGFRIHVLAPPRDEKLLRIKDRLDETYAADDAASPHAAVLANGLAIDEGRLDVDDDPTSPFARVAGWRLSELLGGGSKAADVAPAQEEDIEFLSAFYAGPAHFAGPIDKKLDRDIPHPDQSWRRIDRDWLGAASELALQLDSKTNNTSFVFALEIVATGRTLIFAADAQVGSWQSWPGVEFRNDEGKVETTGADLLRRAVFYKVGHHASRNATRSEGGLEAMVSPDLTAFVPTDEKMAKKVHWHDIPADNLLKRLHDKTAGRVIQSDRPWLHDSALEAAVKTGGSLRSVEVKHGLSVIVEIA